MRPALTLHLHGATQHERITDVKSFVGADASGSFGILPGRAPFVTVLEYGLARFGDAAGRWRYLACPGAVLQLVDDALFVLTRRYLLDEDYARISALLAGQLAQEEAQLQAVKDNLQRMEQELFRRLRRLEVWESD
ncbi:F0F1 ATP synthase subunit epsilon [Sulfuricystis multivorans]|uniref:F0F1 ATP synthase subunit epsilon n=1 Tax=Sulfuricystis multivorans TaxID=2211108 RepID=UPI000F83AC6E|nr:F0F1 ATP synthase subunit epsilon [Sulfuricystis multivorans]